MVDCKINAEPDKLAYSIDEVRRLVGIGRTSVFKAIKARQLPIAKCGSRTLILPADLKSWIESLRIEPHLDDLGR